MVKPARTRNPERTRNNLLQAGVRLFADHGYDSTSVDQIVEAAGVSKRMLYHYFENKDGLYLEVLKTVFGQLEDLEISTLQPPVNPEDAIRSLCREYFVFIQTHPEFVNLIMWENLNRGRFLAEHPDLLTKTSVLQHLQRIIAEGHREQKIVERIDPQHLLVLLYSISFIYYANRFSIPHTVGLDLQDQEIRREGMEQAVRILLHGLIPPKPTGCA